MIEFGLSRVGLLSLQSWNVVVVFVTVVNR